MKEVKKGIIGKRRVGKRKTSIKNSEKLALRILNQSRVVGMMWELRIPGYISNYQQNKQYALISSIELRQEAKNKLIV